MRRLLFALALLTSTRAAAQQPFDLSVKNIMRGPELYGREPAQVRFTADGQWIYFRWLTPGAKWNEDMKPYRVTARAGATPELVSDAHMDSVAPMLATGRRSKTGAMEVFAASGDLWLRTRSKGAVTHRRITQTNGFESDPKFSLDEKEIFFVRDGNVYAFDIATGLTRQLTDIRSGTAPRDAEAPKGQRGALAEQQKALFEVIRDELAQDSVRAAQRKTAESRNLPIVWIPTTERVGTVSISPDGKSVMLTTFTQAQGTKGSDVPDFINADGYPRMIPGRTKVGDAQGSQKAGHMDVATGKVTWVELTPDKKAAGSAQIGDWSDDGKFALLFTTSADFKNRYLYSVASAGGAAKLIDTLRDEAWVNGPCFGCMGWTPQGKAWFVSEESGYSHLYAVNADGSAKTALTSGNWEVLQADRASDNTNFFLVTSEPSPFTRQAYRMAMTGGARTRLTSGDGGHAPVVSPVDANVMATVYSTPNMPPELFLTRAGAAQMNQLTTSTTAEFRSYAWKVPPIVMIDGEDGTKVPARVYEPKAFGKQSNGAAVIFVHGAGYLHNVHNWWSTYSREYMFHHLLAERGYTVIDIDYRGSAGYGRDWRTAIYRWMGGKDLDDHVSGSKYLTKTYGIQPERIGIYGGSYGGFMTLMALFTKSEYFGAGAALRSVTDWASYNHGYTGRILNLPQDDKESYKKSSPIWFAEGLKDPLLIAHGMVDVNVQFQDVVHLSQRLIELEKTDWEMAVYPVEDHGFVRPSSWHDEYRRILELFERTIGPNGSKVRR